LLGLMYGLRGDFERGRELLVQAGAMQMELGMEIARAAGTTMMHAELERLAQDYDAAEGLLRPAVELLRRAGEKGYASTVVGYLAQISYLQGKLDEAEELAREADEIGGADDVETQRLSLCVRGLVLARRGETAEGERLVRIAVELLAPTDALLSQADVALALAAVLGLANRAHEASAAARDAAAIYAAKGADAGVRLAEARAAELEV
jgi:hypothetical protein